VVDAGEEVGVVADRRGKLQAAVGGAMKELRAQALDAGAIRAGGIEQLADASAQRNACLAPERKQRIQRRA
jgi:hypothetical protein